jgi:hypothetical protein
MMRGQHVVNMDPKYKGGYLLLKQRSKSPVMRMSTYILAMPSTTLGHWRGARGNR